MATPVQSGNYPSTQNTQSMPNNAASTAKPRRNMLSYAIIGALLVIIVVLGYFAFFASSTPTAPNQNIYSNLTNKSLTPAQHLYYTDLAKEANLYALSISYSTGKNVTRELSGVSNATLLVTANQTINSETLGNDSTSTLHATLTYQNAATNVMLISNTSQVYFYDTPQNTVTCLNQTASVGSISNSNLTCTYGDGGLYYLESFPFVITNVTALGYLGPSSVTYVGTKTILNRTCDDFTISNATGSTDLLSNYTTVSTCLDTQYGVPLYFNQTYFSGGLSYPGMLLVVQNISGSAPASNFVIPQLYLTKASSAPLI